ncbi:MAG: site-specific integrase [Gemmatimonadota bacterium]
MSVIKRKDGRWRIDIVIRRGGKAVRVKQAAKGARNKSEAQAMERTLRAKLEHKRDPGSKAPDFGDFAKDFLEKYAKVNNKLSEYQSKKQILDTHLTPWFSGNRLDEIADEDVEAYKAAKVELKLSPKTVNNHLAVLSKLYSLAIDWHRVSSGPRIKRLRVPVQDFDFLTFDEADRLIASAGDWRHMVAFALNTGLRHGELLGLRWSDIHGTKMVVRQAIVRGEVTTPKSHKPREVPLNKTAMAALEQADAGVGSIYVFDDEHGSILTRGECKWPLWSACAAAGLRRIGWHVLRHTFASHLAMRGVPIKTIQELLGHSDLKMTMRYAHLSPDVKIDAVGLLEQRGTTSHTAGAQGPVRDRSEDESS